MILTIWIMKQRWFSSDIYRARWISRCNRRHGRYGCYWCYWCKWRRRCTGNSRTCRTSVLCGFGCKRYRCSSKLELYNCSCKHYNCSCKCYKYGCSCYSMYYCLQSCRMHCANHHMQSWCYRCLLWNIFATYVYPDCCCMSTTCMLLRLDSCYWVPSFV